MGKLFKAIWTWIGHWFTLQSILQTEFVRTALLPTVFAVLTALAGYAQHQPLMWVALATALVFMSVMQGLLRGDELRERKNPEHKIGISGMFFLVDLQPTPIPKHLLGNRHQRLAMKAKKEEPQELPSTQIMAGVNRNLTKGQLSIEIKNNASFPISFFLNSAETEVDGEQPPRGKFPKGSTLLRPGQSMRVMDNSIEFDKVPCRRLTGKIDWNIKYGLPGKETFDLNIKAALDIQIEKFGFVTAVVTQWLA